MFQSRFIDRLNALKEKYPVEMMQNATPEFINKVSAEHQAVFDEELWSTADITKLYGLSRQNLSNISRRHGIPGRIKLGDAVFYTIEFAKPWFDAYVARNGGK